MSKKRYKKRKQQRADWAKIEAAGKKRSSWAKIGGSVLGGLATLATGGAAAPIVAALAAGGATWAGSKLGDWAARQSKEGRAEGTRWYGSQKAGLDEMIDDQIKASSLKAGIMGGLGQMGGKLSFGKEGLKVSGKGIGEQSLLKSGKNIFSADKAALGDQTGLGRLFDFRGSQLGGCIEKLKTMAATHKENKLMEAAKAQYADVMKGRRVAAHQAKVDQSIGLSHQDFSLNVTDKVNPYSRGVSKSYSFDKIDQGYRNTNFLDDAGLDQRMKGMKVGIDHALGKTQRSYANMLNRQDALATANIPGLAELREQVDLVGDDPLNKFDQARKDLFLNQNVATDQYGQFQFTHPDTGEAIGTSKFMGKGGQIVEGEGFYKKGIFGGKNVMKPGRPEVPVASYDDDFDTLLGPIDDQAWTEPDFEDFGDWKNPPLHPDNPTMMSNRFQDYTWRDQAGSSAVGLRHRQNQVMPAENTIGYSDTGIKGYGSSATSTARTKNIYADETSINPFSHNISTTEGGPVGMGHQGFISSTDMKNLQNPFLVDNPARNIGYSNLRTSMEMGVSPVTVQSQQWEQHINPYSRHITRKPKKNFYNDLFGE